MNRQRAVHLLRRALTSSPTFLAAKVLGKARSYVASLRELRLDHAYTTYGAWPKGFAWESRVGISAADIPGEVHRPLRLLGDQYMAHRFDLLGSGLVQVRYGMTCGGFLGHRYPSGTAVTADRGGDWLKAHLNPSNLEMAKGFWRCIDDARYQPIDWQVDFRSGFRWRGDVHASRQPIPVDAGADVKVPWELGRLQHFPNLALCAIISASGADGFAPASRYIQELRNQLLDFLALNPPRFGAQWMCPMDVAIRAANIVMTADLLAGAGLKFDQDMTDVIMCALRDHAIHVVDHLEWAEMRRGNHYLSNLLGLAWVASHLPPDPETDAMLAFAVPEFLSECDGQFTSDGGNYEGSTHYHRLSGEILLYGIALASGLSDADIARISSGRVERLKLPVKANQTQTGATKFVSTGLFDKLFRASELTRAATLPSNEVIQIGDTDSGVLFKLSPVGHEAVAAGEAVFLENPLDHRAFVAGVNGLMARANRQLESVIVQQLARGATFSKPTSFVQENFGDIDSLIELMAALPSTRMREISLVSQRGLWTRAAFPEFGLYCLRRDDDFIAFRCAPPPPPAAPRGHRHDDNLGVEYFVGEQFFADPGTFCYTPSKSERDRYRTASAHDVVRAIDWDLAAPDYQMFDLKSVAWARCVAWQANGVAGEVKHGSKRLMRALRLTERTLQIWDAVDPESQLRPLGDPIPVAMGYGRRDCGKVNRA